MPHRYFEASRLNQRLLRYNEALRCAERGLELDRDCLGEDHALYLEDLKIMKELKSLASGIKN
jgi:hypothetical protein